MSIWEIPHGYTIIIHFIELKFVKRLHFFFFLLVVKMYIYASCFLYFFVCVCDIRLF